MQRYVGSVTLALLIAMVFCRALLMKKGIRAIYFGNLDKRDFLIPPFVFFYFYFIVTAELGFSTISRQEFFHSNIISVTGQFFCFAGLLLFLASLISFGRSFRVGIDPEHSGELVTNGVFSMSRNPIYVAFGLVLLGEFLIFSNWVLLVYLLSAVALFHRQVLLEEQFLKRHYGQDYLSYCSRVGRYL